MTLFDAMMVVNTIAAIGRQLSVAHAKIYTFWFGMVMNVGFTVGYISEGLWSGLVFSLVHSALTAYGWVRWKYGWNDNNK